MPEVALDQACWANIPWKRSAHRCTDALTDASYMHRTAGATCVHFPSAAAAAAASPSPSHGAAPALPRQVPEQARLQATPAAAALGCRSRAAPCDGSLRPRRLHLAQQPPHLCQGAPQHAVTKGGHCSESTATTKTQESAATSFSQRLPVLPASCWHTSPQQMLLQLHPAH